MGSLQHGVQASASHCNSRAVGQGEGGGCAVPAKGKGFGLTSMEQRVDTRGGIFIVRSGKAKGTLVEARIPI